MDQCDLFLWRMRNIKVWQNKWIEIRNAEKKNLKSDFFDIDGLHSNLRIFDFISLVETVLKWKKL